MIGFRRIEALQRIESGRNFSLEDLGTIKLCDVCLCDRLLSIVDVEDRGAILSTDVATLAIELGRIVGHGEVDTQDLTKGNLLRIEVNLNRFGVTSPSAAHGLILGRGFISA